VADLEVSARGDT